MRRQPRVLLPVLSAGVFASACSQDLGITRFNSTPEAYITSHVDGSPVDEGEMVTLRGAVSDANDPAEDLVSTWFAGGQAICPDALQTGDGMTLCTTELTGDQGVIVLVASDPEGASGSATVTLLVATGTPPTADLLSPLDGGHYYSDQAVLFQAQIDDDEQGVDELLIEWTSSLDGPLDVAESPDSGGLLESYFLLSQGEHEIELAVSDSSGRAARSTARIEVGPPNSAPTCSILSPVDGTLGVMGQTMVFGGQVADVDDGPASLVVTWSSDKDGALGSSSPDSSGGVSMFTDSLSADTHVISMVVVDDQFESCTDSVVVEVTAPPVLTISSPVSGSTHDVGSTINFVGNASDEEDGSSSLLVSFSSSIDGTFWSGSPDGAGNINFLTDDLSQGRHVVTAVAVDSSGLEGTSTLSLQVNGAPGAPVVSVGPEGATSSQDLIATVLTESVDPDGDAVTYSYAWYRDGDLITSGGATLDASRTTRGEDWTVVVTPSDGRLSGTTASATIEIQNSPPELTSVSLSPTEPTKAAIITASSTSSDADGDTVTVSWAWYVNGVRVSPTSTYLPTTYFDRGETVYAVGTPSDGSSSGDTLASATATVANALPSAPSVAIDPTDPQELVEDLFCDVVTASTDADGDTVSYSVSWTVDGEAYVAGGGPDGDWVGPETTTYTDDSVSGVDTVEAQEWVCTVTVSDGYDSRSQDSDPVEIAGVFEFTSSQTIDGATVTCTSTTSTSEYTECQDFQADGRYMANGVGCLSSWSTTASRYSDFEGLCESLTGSTEFEAYYVCSTTTSRATWNGSVWSTRNDNGYTQDFRCYYP